MERDNRIEVVMGWEAPEVVMYDPDNAHLEDTFLGYCLRLLMQESEEAPYNG